MIILNLLSNEDYATINDIDSLQVFMYKPYSCQFAPQHSKAIGRLHKMVIRPMEYSPCRWNLNMRCCWDHPQNHFIRSVLDQNVSTNSSRGIGHRTDASQQRNAQCGFGCCSVTLGTSSYFQEHAKGIPHNPKKEPILESVDGSMDQSHGQSWTLSDG